MRRRLAASASRACVSSFSSTSSSSRAAFHSCGDTIGGKFMVIWSSFLVVPGGTRPFEAEIRRGRGIHRRWISDTRRIPDDANERRTEMGKIVMSEFVTLDGVIQDPAGNEGFRHGGWFGRV